MIIKISTGEVSVLDVGWQPASRRGLGSPVNAILDWNMPGTTTLCTRALRATLGIAGVVMLGVSFAVNNGPPPDAAAVDLLRFAAAHHVAVTVGAWLQAVGTVLLSAFAIVIVNAPSSRSSGAAALVLLGVSALTCVSLFEVALYLTAVNASTVDMARLALAMIASVQHLYFIVAAPAVFLPLGLEAARSGALPRALAWPAALLGAAFFIVGVATLSLAELPAWATALASVQAVWWLAAAVWQVVERGGRNLPGRAINEPSLV